MTTKGPFLFREYAIALKKCHYFATYAEPGQIGFCIGPGGAGKTSLAQHLERELFGHPNTWAAGKQPIVRVEADLADRGYYSSKVLIEDMLRAVRDPFRSSIQDVLNWDVDDELKKTLLASLKYAPRGKHEPEMRTAFCSIAKLLEVKLLVIDEANLLVLTQRGRVPTDFLESIRRLGDRAECPVLLFGTFDMLELMGYSAQLNRRKYSVHLERMRCEDQAGRSELFSFLQSIAVDYKFDPSQLTEHIGEIYDFTYGIPGEIVGLIKRATFDQLAEGAPELQWAHIRNARQHFEAIKQLRLEADLIYNVLNDIQLTPEQQKAALARKKYRMKPRRVAIGRA